MGDRYLQALEMHKTMDTFLMHELLLGLPLDFDDSSREDRQAPVFVLCGHSAPACDARYRSPLLHQDGVARGVPVGVYECRDTMAAVADDRSCDADTKLFSRAPVRFDLVAAVLLRDLAFFLLRASAAALHFAADDLLDRSWGGAFSRADEDVCGALRPGRRSAGRREGWSASHGRRCEFDAAVGRYRGPQCPDALDPLWTMYLR